MWVTALRRTSVTALVGMGACGTAFCAIGTKRSATGWALAASASAFLRALIPPTTNIEASIGRAISLETVMGHSYTTRASSGPPPEAVRAR